MFLKKHSSKKRRVKENLHPFLDLQKSLVTKDEEKTEVINDLFATVFNSRTSSSLVLRPWSWKRMKPCNPRGNYLHGSYYTTGKYEIDIQEGSKGGSRKE